jgi:hypothetical protein
MANNIRKVDYFYTSVKDRPGESYQILSQLADIGIGLLAFTAVPTGPDTTQLALFPEDSSMLLDFAERAGMRINGPNHAILVQGNDELGALTKVHESLFKAHVNVYASNAVTDGKGGYGYLIYVRPEDFDKAAQALGI